MKVIRWQDLKDKKLTKEEQAAIQEKVQAELLEMDLRAMRELAGKTQMEVATELDVAQSEVSRIERRPDTYISTLRRYVEALGGELEITAKIGDKRVVLRSVS